MSSHHAHMAMHTNALNTFIWVCSPVSAQQNALLFSERVPGYRCCDMKFLPPVCRSVANGRRTTVHLTRKPISMLLLAPSMEVTAAISHYHTDGHFPVSSFSPILSECCKENAIGGNSEELVVLRRVETCEIIYSWLTLKIPDQQSSRNVCYYQWYSFMVDTPILWLLVFQYGDHSFPLSLSP